MKGKIERNKDSALGYRMMDGTKREKKSSGIERRKVKKNFN